MAAAAIQRHARTSGARAPCLFTGPARPWRSRPGCLRTTACCNPNAFLGARLLPGLAAVQAGVPPRLRRPSARKLVVRASFLGVGAPEAILVGVVALVVFGPKGLAEAARGVSQAIRSFKPAIQEVAQVGQDLRGTLEKELGLEELRDVTRPIPLSGSSAKGTPPGLVAASKEDANLVDPEIDAKRAASAAAAWGASPSSILAERKLSQPQAPAQLSGVTLADLEAELARRKAQPGAAAEQVSGNPLTPGQGQGSESGSA